MFAHSTWRAYSAAICAIGLALAPMSGASAQRATAPRWLVADATRHTATVTVIVGYSGANDGLNFNGDANGNATKVGAYYIVCGLPGHAATGMWGRFMVTRGGRPTVTV